MQVLQLLIDGAEGQLRGPARAAALAPKRHHPLHSLQLHDRWRPQVRDRPQPCVRIVRVSRGLQLQKMSAAMGHAPAGSKTPSTTAHSCLLLHTTHVQMPEPLGTIRPAGGSGRECVLPVVHQHGDSPGPACISGSAPVALGSRRRRAAPSWRPCSTSAVDPGGSGRNMSPTMAACAPFRSTAHTGFLPPQSGMLVCGSLVEF